MATGKGEFHMWINSSHAEQLLRTPVCTSHRESDSGAVKLLPAPTKRERTQCRHLRGGGSSQDTSPSLWAPGETTWARSVSAPSGGPPPWRQTQSVGPKPSQGEGLASSGPEDYLPSQRQRETFQEGTRALGASNHFIHLCTSCKNLMCLWVSRYLRNCCALNSNSSEYSAVTTLSRNSVSAPMCMHERAHTHTHTHTIPSCLKQLGHTGHFFQADRKASFILISPSWI